MKEETIHYSNVDIKNVDRVRGYARIHVYRCKHCQTEYLSQNEAEHCARECLLSKHKESYGVEKVTKIIEGDT